VYDVRNCRRGFLEDEALSSLGARVFGTQEGGRPSIKMESIFTALVFIRHRQDFLTSLDYPHPVPECFVPWEKGTKLAAAAHPSCPSPNLF
jgi:hypothetical protein